MTDKRSNTTYVMQCLTCGVLGHMCIDTISGRGKKFNNLLEDGREHKIVHPDHVVTMVVTHVIVEEPMGRA